MKIYKTARNLLLFILVFFSLQLFLSAKKYTEPRIFLYGELHSNAVQQEKELEEWGNFYEQGRRHLFIESGYPTAQLLNRWLKTESDDIFEFVYENWNGTQSYTETTWNFYHTIKQKYPETIFHGIDVEHQYKNTGNYYLKILQDEGLENSEEYTVSLEHMKQASKYYSLKDAPYRENCMAGNFIREFDSLPETEKIMGIFGGAHCGLNSLDFTGKIPCMANQLNKHYKKIYGNIIESIDITYLQPELKPISVKEVKIKGKVYKASYFGEEDMSGWHKTYKSRKFWRIEDSYDDFKKYFVKFDCLPYDNYPTAVHTGDVFRIEYEKADGSKVIRYYRSDGKKDKEYGYITGFIFQEKL